MRIPYEATAEANVVGCALARPGVVSIDPEDCYVPLHARLLRAVADLDDIAGEWCDPYSVDWPALWPMRYPDFEHLRAAAAAVVAGEDIDAACRLVDERYEPGVSRDAVTVTQAARARRAMAVLAGAYNALGEGAEVDQVAELVSSAVG